MTDIRPLPALLAKKAQEELNEDPSRIEENLRLLREWIAKQQHFKARTDSQFLIAFLRTNKSSVERAKEKIEGYYTIRHAVPELFANRNVNDPKLQSIFKLGVGIMLPDTDGEDGPRISIIRAGIYDPSKYDIKDIIKAGTFVGDIQILEDDNMVISGHTEIMDMANISLGHAMQMDVGFMKKLAAVGEGGTPLRHKGLHFINTPPGFNTLFNIFCSFLGKKSRLRLFSHGSNMESLYKYVPKHLLPVEYGGTNSSIPEIICYWEGKIVSYKDYFDEDVQYGIIDQIRQTNQTKKHETKQGSSFGADGTFRQLGID